MGFDLIASSITDAFDIYLLRKVSGSERFLPSLLPRWL